ncbi:hypothetical protein ES707_03390 [subsurface metagenome]
MLNILLVTDSGAMHEGYGWSSGITCLNVVKFADPNEFKITVRGSHEYAILNWFRPGDEEKYDLIWLHNLNGPQGKQIHKYRKVRDTKEWRIRLTAGIRGQISLVVTRSLLHLYDGFACNGKHFLKALQKWGAKAYLCENGVDTETFKPLCTRKDEPFTIGFAGSAHRPVKNFRAIKMLGYPVKRASKQQQQRQINPYSTPHYIPYAKMPKFHNSYDVYVCASKSEGLPNPLLEAAASGKPIVSTSVGAVPEIVEEEWLVDGDPGIDPEAFKEMKRKVELLKDDYDLRLKVGQRNREEVVKHWDWRIKVKEYEHFFRSVCENG